MGITLTVRIDDDLARWLDETARKRGLSRGKLVRDQLAKGRKAGNKVGAQASFMRLAGSVVGPKDLSARKGFSRR
jgi:hypothetical protein